ncbi:MAG: glutaredoxin family protein [Candidatus Obscuribacterales bacterium]|nr:glutaredoxin family protein [Candidatus Obscuribacterales bacterium]
MQADDENQISGGAADARCQDNLQVTLYTVPGCPLCSAAREMLTEMGISYVQQDVANSYPALRRMYKLTRQGLVPVIEYNGRALVRPTSEELSELVRK